MRGLREREAQTSTVLFCQPDLAWPDSRFANLAFSLAASFVCSDRRFLSSLALSTPATRSGSDALILHARKTSEAMYRRRAALPVRAFALLDDDDADGTAWSVNVRDDSGAEDDVPFTGVLDPLSLAMAVSGRREANMLVSPHQVPERVD